MRNIGCPPKWWYVPCIVIVSRFMVLGVVVGGALSIVIAANLSAASTPAARHTRLDATGEILKKGKFLVAATDLVDPNFSKTVVYVVAYGQGGAIGVVVNRPTGVQLGHALPHLEGRAHAQDVIYAGGPVGRGHLLILVRSDTYTLDEGIAVTDEITASSNFEKLSLLADAAHAQFHVYVGYAGWSPGQLDTEVARGDWLVRPGDIETLFTTDPLGLWESMITDDGLKWPRGLLPTGRHRRTPPRIEQACSSRPHATGHIKRGVGTMAVPEWITRLFRSIDDKDLDTFTSFLTEDASFRFANQAPLVGKTTVRNGVADFLSGIKSIQHETLDAWENGGATTCHGIVTYTRHDSSQLRVPCANVFTMQGMLIKEYMVFVDSSQLYPDTT